MDRVITFFCSKAHEANPKSHAMGTGLVFVEGKWVAPQPAAK